MTHFGAEYKDNCNASLQETQLMRGMQTRELLQAELDDVIVI